MPDTSQLLSDEPEMESSLHYMQLLMLVTSGWRDQEDFFIGATSPFISVGSSYVVEIFGDQICFS